MDETLKKALLKRAVGYIQKEIAEEYTSQDGKLILIKRKVTTKDIPPDLDALKIILNEKKDYSSLSDEDLQAEWEKVKREIEDSNN